ncbi:lantibiotic dehydratase [Olivibacter domesticus]|uniref:Thiopeptide-type bacteriocin biosynthesis domain-containing protein n=1 Tax=Olivibacter domesticus TaxID=407022 RepID=A0A1H7GPJ7_OLID1|nr:lantibiotic dehydratase [Olivibacter domesticus]SEK37785.1 thiopeptide-type bacteriocin biosynthesis domain-containing protein [Olivibacter domesticus]
MPRNIESFDFFLLRAPSLPLKVIQQINANNGMTQLDGALQATLANYPEVLQAISFANRELYNTYLDWLRNGHELDEKLLLTLYKYIARMATRPTPFGCFAGVSIGILDDKPTALRLKGEAEIHMRLSIDYLADKISPLLKDDRTLEDITFYTNNSISTASNYFSYIRYEYIADKKSFFQIRLKKNPLLNVLHDHAKEGRTFKELLLFLQSFDIAHEQAAAYLLRLIANQFLIWEFEPTVLGVDYSAWLKSKLMTAKGIGKELKALLASLPTSTLDMHINKLPQDAVLMADKKLIPEKACLNRSVIRIISNELNALYPLFKSSIPPDLQLFIKRFKARYDMMEVSLLEVLDGDLGIGYGDLEDQYKNEHPLIRELSMRIDTKNITVALEELLIANSLGYGSGQIDLEKMYKTLERPLEEVTVAPTFYAIGNLLANTSEELDKGNFSFNLTACSGSSAVNLMSRFAYMDQDLKKSLQRCAAYEESCFENAVLADIVHVPENRLANILQRPALYNYQISLLAHGAVSDEKQIPLTDLYISVRNNVVILFSKKLQKRVIPRLSCAHNFKMGISIYRFLCDLQYQDSPFAIHWAWDRFKETPFLPRIYYRHIILSRARWFVKKIDYNEISINKLQAEMALPDEILIAEGDNELYINLRTDWGIKLLRDKLVMGDVVLYEFFAHNNAVLLDKKENAYINELIIPFKSVVGRPKQLEAKPIGEQQIKRSFILGSEWIYVKLYCTQKTADEMLVNALLTLAEKLVGDRLIMKWFFTRYYDPDFHIRLRFLVCKKNKRFFGKIQGILHATFEQLIAERKIWKVQYDTYVRELERYGSVNMELCESIFYIDSVAVLNLLKRLDREDHTTRWLLALRATHQLLDIFGIDMHERFELTEAWSLALGKEFDLNKNQKKQLNLNYRYSAMSIETLLNESNRNDLGGFEDIFETRYTKIVLLLQQRKIKKIEVMGLLGSLCHMHLNRLFFSDQRANEMVIYAYLAKYYRSKLARTSKQASVYEKATVEWENNLMVVH